MILVKIVSQCELPVKSQDFDGVWKRAWPDENFRHPNNCYPALESFVIPLSTTYLKTKRVKGLADSLQLAP